MTGYMDWFDEPASCYKRACTVTNRDERFFMKARIDRDGCISCGLCPSICPEVFRMAEDDIAEVWQEDVPKEIEDLAIEAQESCPVSVIFVE